MRKSFNIVNEMCKVKSSASNDNKTFPNGLTPRVSFIIDVLRSNGIDHEINIFKTRKNLVNIHVTFKGITNNNIMFVAHHDIVNPKSENVNDNTASVSNLLALAIMLKGKILHNGVSIVFTDGEEIGGLGAMQLAKDINKGRFGKIMYAINIELTAYGTEMWADKHDSVLGQITKDKGMFQTETPFNDSWILRDNNIDSVCIGTITKKDKVDVLGKGYCDTWVVCHKESDKLSNAIESDMTAFTNVLFGMATPVKVSLLTILKIKAKNILGL